MSLPKALAPCVLLRLSIFPVKAILVRFDMPTKVMRFALIDRITEIKPGESLVAVKNLSMAEEYLQDHFPLFPVMPGVMMLEAAYQAGAWLVRSTENFAHSMVNLAEAKNVTFRDFVEPGETLIVEVRIHKSNANLTTVIANGSVADRPALKARLVLDSFNLADRQVASDTIDAYMISELRRDYDNLCRATKDVAQSE